MCQVRLYVDGVLEQTDSESSATDVDNMIDIIIGGLRPTGAASQFLNGKVDDIAIFNNALSQAEVTAILNNGVAGIPEPSGWGLFAAFSAAIAISRRRNGRGVPVNTR